MRLFIGIKIPEELKQRIGSIQKELVKYCNIKLVESENLHFCLKFIGETNKINEIAESLYNIGFKKFDISIKGVVVFPGLDYIRIIGLESDSHEMKKLAGIINEELSKTGIPKEKREFKSHLTLGRVKSVSNREGLKKYLERVNDVGKFTADSFCIISSVLDKSGPKYKIEKEIELR